MALVQPTLKHWMMTPSWRRGTATLEGDWIVVRDLEPYQLPAGPGRRDLPFTLAGIRSPDEAVAFAGNFGLLRTSWPDDDVLGLRPFVRERYADWEREIRTLAGILSLYVDLGAALAGDVESERSLRDVFVEVESEPPAPKYTGLAWLEMIVNDHIATMVEAGREGVKTVFRSLSAFGTEGSDDDDLATGLAFVTQTDTLIETMYQQLAVLMTEQQPMRNCLDCRRVFLRRTQRQRFCNNVCANRTRSRRNMAKMRASAQVALTATATAAGTVVRNDGSADAVDAGERSV